MERQFFSNVFMPFPGWDILRVIEVCVVTARKMMSTSHLAADTVNQTQHYKEDLVCRWT